MIRLENFSKKYEKKSLFAVENLTLDCGHGLYSFIGENGVGKSTIFKALATLHYPSQGKIFFYTKSDFSDSIDYEKDLAFVRSRTAFSGEAPMLPKNLTVYELLEDTLMLHNFSKDSIQNKIDTFLKDFELEEVKNKKISKLSSGFLHRSALAAAMIFEPENLILDESFSSLDPLQIARIRKIVKNYSKNHTVLLSSHIMQEVSSLSDYIYIIFKGKIKKSGREEDILRETSSKNLEEAFLKLKESEGKEE